MTTYDFSFGVAGGGPAGCSAAIALAQRGHSVVLFERDKFPRFHIGESLLATANDAFEALGVTDRMQSAGFPQKWGARLINHNGQSGRGVNFADVRDVKRPQTYQVPRAEFDRILLERAREAGVDVREGCQVTACEFGPDGVVIDANGRLKVKAIVDATGRNGLLARKFDLRRDEPRLANIAIFSHYKNVPLLPGNAPHDIRIVSCDHAGWFWVLPISEELMSVGVVMPRSLFLASPEATPEEHLERAIASTPAVAELMRNAKREWPVRVEKDFSYSATQYAGDRWILAGDAGSFLDPVFSTGVTIAMESGIEAAAELDRAAKTNDFSANAFRAFSRRQEKRFRVFRQFVIGFYTPQFRDLFFQPDPPAAIFRSVTTILAGRWNASLGVRLLNRVFFALVSLQKRFALAERRFRRGENAGYAAQ